MAITYMAKFDEREGNSCHIHFSLDRRGRPAVRARPDDLRRPSSPASSPRCASSRCCSRPNINSYKRYAAGSFAPTAIAWGHDNRTCALRVVGHGAGLRFENRAGGADLNPYMALVGADRRRACTASSRGSSSGRCSRATPTARRSCRACRPRCAARASCSRAPRSRASAFGEDVVAHYVNAADVELAAFGRAVTDWERFRGFERL